MKGQNSGSGSDKSPKGKKITRKQALKKAGFIALSASTMMLLLNQPGKAQDTSSMPGGPGDW